MLAFIRQSFWVGLIILAVPAVASATEGITMTGADSNYSSMENFTISGQVTWASTDTHPTVVIGGIEVWNAATSSWDEFVDWNELSFSLSGSSPGTWSKSGSAPNVSGKYRFWVESQDSNGNNLATSTSEFTVP